MAAQEGNKENQEEEGFEVILARIAHKAVLVVCISLTHISNSLLPRGRKSGVWGSVQTPCFSYEFSFLKVENSPCTFRKILVMGYQD